MNHANALAQQQRDLLQAIFTTNSIAAQAINTASTSINDHFDSHSARGLKTYRANAAASALRSLQTAYPVIAQLIGDEAFAHLARDFWAQHPPMRGDLAQWGGELTVLISKIPALQTEPYLSDVARAEWALHTCATAANKDADLATFAQLTLQDPDTLTLELAAGTTLIHSQYPIASLLTAHLYAAPSFAKVGQKLLQNSPEIALVWRQGLRPMVTTCTVAEAAFLEQLLSGKSLLAALESDELAASGMVFDLQHWLPQAVQNGLLLGVISV